MEKDSIEQTTNFLDWDALIFSAKSIFSPAAPINEFRLFAGRKEQLRRLLGAIAERGRHAILYGERGVGKTSLSNTFHMVLGIDVQKNIVTIRKQVSPIDNYTTLWSKIFRDITFNIKTGGDYGNDRIETHSVAERYQGEITPDDVMRELGVINPSVSLVVIFDEFDKISNIETKQLMSHTIKALSDSGINATIIIVGVADDINALVEEHESVRRNIEEIKMPRMSVEELNEILDERLPLLNLEIESTARAKIITLSRGLPEYVHALGRNASVTALESQRRIIVSSDIDAAVKETIEQSDQSSNNAYKKAIHSNKKNALYSQVLLACALAKTDDEGKFTPSDVIQPLSKILNRSITIANFQSHLAIFCTEDRGRIIEKHGTSWAFKYRFREPKMQPYVIMQGIRAGTIDSNILTIPYSA